MPTYLVSDLITGTRQKADMQNSAFVTDSEILGYLNSGWQKLYGLIVQRFENYYIDQTTIALMTNTSEYPLPSDFFKMLGIDLNVGSGVYTLRPWSFNERNKASQSAIDSPSRYIIVGNKVKFVPTPSNNHTATVYYVPMPTALTLLGSIELPPYGEEYLTSKAGVDCKQKEESDPSVLMAQEQEAERFLLEVLANRDNGLPMRMTDTSAMNDGAFDRWWTL